MGVVLVLWICCKKDKELIEMIKGVLLVGILGIGELLIYGVILFLGCLFIIVCIGGGIGGVVIGMIGNVGVIVIGFLGVVLILLIFDGKWLGYIFGLLVVYVGGFVVIFFFGIFKDCLEKEELVIEIVIVNEVFEKVVF